MEIWGGPKHWEIGGSIRTQGWVNGFGTPLKYLSLSGGWKPMASEMRAEGPARQSLSALGRN
eukprot:1582982-Amphidinium_carterae.1